MRDRRGTPDTCLAKVQGEDLDELLCSLRAQESLCPSGPPSWASKPVVDGHGDSQNETLSLEMKSDLSEANLLLHSGTSVLACLKESVRRNSASTVAQSKTVDLFFAPAEECFAGVACGVKEALVRDWLGGWPRATYCHRGRCCRGEPWGSGLPCCQKRSEVGISKDEPTALLEGRGSEQEPSRWPSVLSTVLHAHPEVFPNDETGCVSPGRSEYRKQQNTGKCFRV